MPIELPPGLWVPPKPAIVRAASLKDVERAMPFITTFGAGSISGFVPGGKKAVSTHPTLPTNLLAYWRLEEASGTRYDSVGSLHLTDTNTVLQGTGKHGNCADFEHSSTEYLTSGTTLVSTIGTGAYSAFAWINPESIASYNTYGGGIFATVAAEADGSFQLSLKSDGALWFYKWSGTNRRYKTNTTPCSSLATWYHVGITYTGTGSDTATIYVNGSSVAATDDAGGASGWGTHTSIGIQYVSTPTGYSFDGLIDEVGMWSKVLSAQEISDLYNGGAGIPYL